MSRLELRVRFQCTEPLDDDGATTVQLWQLRPFVRSPNVEHLRDGGRQL
jgi:hypothetical protein